MANEIEARLFLRVDTGGLETLINESFTATQTNAGGPAPGYAQLTTSESVIALTALTGLGVAFLYNMDDTNTAEYGPESGGAMVPFGEIPPLHWALLNFKSGITLRMKATAGTAKVAVQVFEA